MVFAKKCLSLYENRELCQRLSIAARERIVEKFSAENMARQYYNLYLEIAGKR